MTYSLYIHIPFCQRRCHYCDFYSTLIPVGNDHIRKYIDRISIQYDLLINRLPWGNPDNLYIGGGTPSLLDDRSLEKLHNLIIRTDGEVTIEINPESINEEKLFLYDQLGINRLSIGIQSFNDDVLSSMGRLSLSRRNRDVLELILAKWKKNWSIDLIFGYPGQTFNSQWNDFVEAMRFSPPHFSLYTLSVEEGSVLHQQIGSHELKLPQEEEMDDCWFRIVEKSEVEGYERYEISSFAQEGFRSKHNVNYWEMGNWIGLGSAAGSQLITGKGLDLQRFSGKDVNSFLSLPQMDLGMDGRFYSSELVTGKEAVKEIIMMGLRQSRGLKRSRVEISGNIGLENWLEKTLSRWKGQLIIDKERMYLTRSGLNWHSAVVRDIFGELDQTYACHE